MLNCYLSRYALPFLATSANLTQLQAANASDFLTAIDAAPEPSGQYPIEGSWPADTVVLAS